MTTTKKVLVINTGSSSIKYQLFDMPAGRVLCAGLVERIGETSGTITHTVYPGTKNEKKVSEKVEKVSHTDGMHRIATLLVAKEWGVLHSVTEVALVGHRVVHGGEAFSDTLEITPQVKEKIRELIPLAPLHNPANLTGIEIAENLFSEATQVAVFDTAFHQSLPPKAYRYAIPNSLYTQHGIRVYGFHGTSHKYIATQTAKLLGKPQEATSLISIHLGNGASMAAIKNGQSIDTSLGLTPLPGLVMGTRSGDIDPGVVFYLSETLGYSLKEIKRLLNKQSGLKGLANDNDMRDITQRAQQGEEEAQLALEVYTYRIQKYIGAYLVALGQTPDALVFTAGVGENSAVVRSMCLQNMQHVGIQLNPTLNEQGKGMRLISAPDSIPVWVIPTNEELEIAQQAFGLPVS